MINRRKANQDEWLEENTFFLEPGSIFFSSGNGAVKTVLGNSVAVCIWENVLKCGGVCHFIHPLVTDASKATARFGNAGIQALVKIIEDAGGEKNNCIAQVIGGAIPLNNDQNNLGEENVAMAKKILNKKGIKIISEDTGGNMGRKIIFDVSTGQIAVYKVHKIRQDDWFEKDKS